MKKTNKAKWEETNFVLPKGEYNEVKKFIVGKAKDYKVYINPKIIAKSKLHQYDYETCPSFPMYFLLIIITIGSKRSLEGRTNLKFGMLHKKGT